MGEVTHGEAAAMGEFGAGCTRLRDDLYLRRTEFPEARVQARCYHHCEPRLASQEAARHLLSTMISRTAGTPISCSKKNGQGSHRSKRLQGYDQVGGARFELHLLNSD